MRTTPTHPASPGTERTVLVEAPARLHLGFLDPAGSLGRAFGSLGVMVDGFHTCVRLRSASGDALMGAIRVTHGGDALGADAARAVDHLRVLQVRTGRHTPLHLHLSEGLPAHAGLGSGTQLALAVGRAFACWHQLDLPTATVAQWLERGRRSGVGIAGFDHGGFLVDGGPLPCGAPAPMLARVPLPPDWRILLVMDTTTVGLSGAAERAALSRLAPLARAEAAEICHHTLMRVLPGAHGAGFATFAAGISAIQAVLGNHFAPAQSGEAYTSAAVGHLMRWLGAAAQEADDVLPAESLGAGIGQSSWGPTGFAFLPSAERATRLVADARAAGVVSDHLHLRLVKPVNRGARVTQVTEATSRQAPLGTAPILPITLTTWAEA